MCALGVASWPRLRAGRPDAAGNRHSSAPFLLLRLPQPMLSFPVGWGRGAIMQSCCFHWGATTAAVFLALSAGTPLKAAEGAVRPVAEELGQRAAVPQGQQTGGLSDSAVRVLMGYAFSVIPEQQAGPDGKQVKLDKSDPNKFLIPSDDARRIIRAATRSSYAEACELPDLAQANYQALMRSEGAKKTWTEPQLLMVNALYLFSASYFVGNVKITNEGEAANGAAGAANPPKEAAPGPETSLVAPKRPQCPPEQKQKVVAAINAYVQSVPARPAPNVAPPAPAPAQPASSSGN